MALARLHTGLLVERVQLQVVLIRPHLADDLLGISATQGLHRNDVNCLSDSVVRVDICHQRLPSWSTCARCT